LQATCFFVCSLIYQPEPPALETEVEGSGFQPDFSFALPIDNRVVNALQCSMSDKEPKHSIGKIIRDGRERHPDYTSLRKFALSIGKTPSWLSKVERGIETPSPETLAIIAQKLDLSTPVLFWAAGMIEPDIEAFIHQEYITVSREIRRMMAELNYEK
jgi:transcriptional regulator with XRE-family HTH domain